MSGAGDSAAGDESDCDVEGIGSRLRLSWMGVESGLAQSTPDPGVASKGSSWGVVFSGKEAEVVGRVAFVLRERFGEVLKLRGS